MQRNHLKAMQICRLIDKGLESPPKIKVRLPLPTPFKPSGRVPNANLAPNSAAAVMMRRMTGKRLARLPIAGPRPEAGYFAIALESSQYISAEAHRAVASFDRERKRH